MLYDIARGPSRADREKEPVVVNVDANRVAGIYHVIGEALEKAMPEIERAAKACYGEEMAISRTNSHTRADGWILRAKAHRAEARRMKTMVLLVADGHTFPMPMEELRFIADDPKGEQLVKSLCNPVYRPLPSLPPLPDAVEASPRRPWWRGWLGV